MTKPKQDLKSLQATWYKKLKTSGFKDIESINGQLKSWDNHHFLQISPNVFDAQQEFFKLAEWFLNEYKFKNSQEKAIWRRYSQGMSARAIAQDIGLGRAQVTSLVNEFKKVLLKDVHTKK